MKRINEAVLAVPPLLILMVLMLGMQMLSGGV